jgi:hypothetical protein
MISSTNTIYACVTVLYCRTVTYSTWFDNYPVKLKFEIHERIKMDRLKYGLFFRVKLFSPQTVPDRPLKVRSIPERL